MAQSIRQNNLFVAEDWTAIYESYVNANFQAYDFDTIRNTMVDYVRNHYPENYNDWVESSEFVALLDIVAQFGHNLAFRVDLNSRNNFLSTAQRQESVFKLAEFLGYQPRRNIAASGFAKVITIKTNETVIGSQGTTLGGKEVRYENSNNIDNLDDFTTVINAVLSGTNQFGSPRKQATINGITTQFYSLANTSGQIKYNVGGIVQGSSATFNAYNVDYNSSSRSIEEQAPNRNNAFGILYKYDGQGISSNNTGFFFGLKQGDLQYSDFLVDAPVDNMSLDINPSNINEHDVWVQTVDKTGNVIKNWTKVDTTYGSSANYNTLSDGIRDIYSVKTMPDNKISIQFADSSFGNLPKGIIRVWYRTSVNDTYVVRPEDVGTKKISVNYIGADGNEYTATFGIQLKESIRNSSSSESLESIKINAPRVYASQDRMITASDYSGYLIRQSDNILKIKSVNRTHSGHSRYFDYTDPTGAYDNLNVFGKDGILRKEEKVKSDIVGTVGGNRIIDEYLNEILRDPEFLNLYYYSNQDNFNYDRTMYGSETTILQTTGTQGSITSGYFTTSTGTVKAVGEPSTGYLRYATPGALIKFIHPTTGVITWAKVSNVINYGRGVDNLLGVPTGKTAAGIGAVSFDVSIPSGSKVDKIYPAFNRRFPSEIRDSIVEYITNNINIGISYNYRTGLWSVKEADYNSDDWMIYLDNASYIDQTIISSQTVRYTFASGSTVFSNISGEFLLDEETNKRSRDTINIFNPGDFENQASLYISKYDSNGNLVLVMEDKNNDGRPDNPDVLFNLMGQNNTITDLRFEWKHVPAVNELIDPSFTNIVDVFALTSSYDKDYRKYLRDSTGNVFEPLPPTISELNQQFGQVNSKKAMSDKIVYRPVKYKTIFGDKAEPFLQGRLRVIKIPSSTITDNELKNRIVEAVDEFFSLNNWDFGETFYFTELAAYVHQTMPGIVSSLVIVPEGSSSAFGDLFQITPNTDEIFIPDIDVNSIDIISSINQTTIRN